MYRDIGHDFESVVGGQGQQGLFWWPIHTQRSTLSFANMWLKSTFPVSYFIRYHIHWLSCFQCCILWERFNPITFQLACVVRFYEICPRHSESPEQACVRKKWTDHSQLRWPIRSWVYESKASEEVTPSWACTRPAPSEPVARLADIDDVMSKCNCVWMLKQCCYIKMVLYVKSS